MISISCVTRRLVLEIVKMLVSISYFLISRVHHLARIRPRGKVISEYTETLYTTWCTTLVGLNRSLQSLVFVFTQLHLAVASLSFSVPRISTLLATAHD